MTGAAVISASRLVPVNIGMSRIRSLVGLRRDMKHVDSEMLRQVGLRGVLCYETTDRNGQAGRDAGLRENARYLERVRHCSQGSGTRGYFAGLAGAHAA